MTDIMKTTETLSDDTARDARRKLIRGGLAGVAALALGGVVAACSEDGDADKVDESDGGSGTTDAGSNDAGATQDAGSTPDADVAPLNALLSAEYNAIAAYTAGAGLIDGAPASDPLASLKDVVLAIATDILAHHQSHAEALVTAINDLGGTPVEQTDVNFTPPTALADNPTIMNVLKLAAGAERGAAVAYNNTVASLESASLRFLAGAIEGDESQHFIVLTALIAGLVQPGANLSTDSADDVIPEAFVSKVGDVNGLEAIPDYFV